MRSSNPHLFSPDSERETGALRGTRCRACATYTLMGLAVCPVCFSRDVEQVGIGRRATLEHWSVVHHGADGFPAPYIIAEIRTDEGPVAFAPLVADPARLARGARLAFQLRPLADGERVGFAYALAEDVS
ncbi:MAG: OB-fold domain-containing protein [Casimicrobiaceae bacterium]